MCFDHLSYFHPITGFPPDRLHDLFEGVVPVDLPHCLKGLIAKTYFTLEELNRAIMSFPFQHSDKVDRLTNWWEWALAPESQKGTHFGRC